MRSPDLERFREAQARASDGLAVAMRELRAGAKRSHWMWWVLPQIRGLGSSGTSVHYAISDFAEAQDFLRDPDLRRAYLDVALVVADHLSRGVRLDRLMGSSIDALKAVSSLTLFGAAARSLHATSPEPSLGQISAAAEGALDVATEQGFPRCRRTMGHTSHP